MNAKHDRYDARQGLALGPLGIQTGSWGVQRCRCMLVLLRHIHGIGRVLGCQGHKNLGQRALVVRRRRGATNWRAWGMRVYAVCSIPPADEVCTKCKSFCTSDTDGADNNYSISCLKAPLSSS